MRHVRSAAVVAGIIFAALAVWTMLPVYGLHGVIGYRHDWDLPPFPQQLATEFRGTDGFTVWNRNDFGTPPFYPNLAPFRMLIGVAGMLGAHEPFLVKVLYTLAFWSAGLGLYGLCRLLGVSRGAAFAAGVVYAFNPFVYYRVCSGVTFGVLNYAIEPLIVYCFIRALNIRRVFNPFLLATIVLGAFGNVEAQNLVLTSAFIIVLALGAKRPWHAVAAIGGFFALDLYWILPLLLNLHGIVSSFSSGTSDAFVIGYSVPLVDSLRMTGSKAPFFQLALARMHLAPWWSVSSWILLLLALCGTVVAARRNNVGWAVAFVIAGCFTAGVYGVPFYLWMLAHVPVLWIFREAFRVEQIYALIFSVCLGYLLTAAGEIFAAPRLRAWRVPLAVFASLAIATFCSTFFLHGLSYDIAAAPTHRAELHQYEAFRSDPRWYRLIQTPFLVPLSKEGSRFPGTDPYIDWAPKPSMSMYLPTPMTKKVGVAFYAHRPNILATLLSWTGVHYVSLRNTYKTQFAKFSEAGSVVGDAYNTPNERKTISELPYRRSSRLSTPYSEVLDTGPLPQHAYVLPRSSATILAGGLQAAPIAAHASGALFIAAQQPPGFGSSKIKRVIIENDDFFDYVFMGLPASFIRQPGSVAQEISPRYGWANFGFWSSWWWYKFRYDTEFTDVAMALSNSSTTLRLDFDQRANPAMPEHVFVRLYEGSANGHVLVRLGKQVRLISAYRHRNRGFVWIDCGLFHVESAGPVQVSITNVDAENVVSDVAALPENLDIVLFARRSSELERSQVAYVLDQRRLDHPSFTAVRSGVVAALVTGEPLSRAHIVVDGAKRTILIDRRGFGWARRALRVRGGANSLSKSATLSRVMLMPARWPRVLPDPLPMAPSARGLSFHADVPWPSVAVVNESYDQWWQTTGPAAHGVVNGYGNAFLVAPGPVRITYVARFAAYVGRALTVLSLTLLLALCFSWPARFIIRWRPLVAPTSPGSEK